MICYVKREQVLTNCNALLCMHILNKEIKLDVIRKSALLQEAVLQPIFFRLKSKEEPYDINRNY